MPLSPQVILVQLETLKLENRHLSEILERAECGELKVCTEDQGLGRGWPCAPTWEYSESLLRLSKWGIELSELKTQGKEAIERKEGAEISSICSVRVVKRIAETAIISMGFGT